MVGMSANRWSGRFALEKFPAIHSRHQDNQNDELGVGSSVNASMLSVTWRYDLTPFLSQEFYRITGFAFVTLCRNTNSMSLNSELSHVQLLVTPLIAPLLHRLVGRRRCSRRCGHRWGSDW